MRNRTMKASASATMGLGESEMAKRVIHYREAGSCWYPYCSGRGMVIVSASMSDVTCKRCLAKLKRDEVVK